MDSSSSEQRAIEGELHTTIQTSRTNSECYSRREQNVNWVRNLSLMGLEYNDIEMQISIVRTQAGEDVVIQYPGKESTQGERTWKNEWDFRPKILKTDSKDLTFAQLWDPLFDDLRTLEGKARKRVGTALATLFYRMAYMLDYENDPVSNYKAIPIRTGEGLVENPLPRVATLGSFWRYRPPANALAMIAHELPEWSGMSFEAFLHYNSLLAWNEDCKVRAKYPEKWTPAKKTGRINTLLTHVRVIGFILDEIRPSTLLGGFASGRGMSPAGTKEIERICKAYLG